MADKLTDIKGIGPKTEQKIRKAIGARNRNTGNAGDELTVREAVKNEAITKSKLAANQQVALSDEAFSFSPTRRAKNTVSRNNNRDRSESDTIRRGDFTVGKDELESARDRFEEVPEDRREEDKNSRDPVVTDLDVWRNNISRFDFPGVDTPSNRRVRTDDTDIALNDTSGLSRPRETFRESKPEGDEAQRELGITPEGADAERTGLVRAKDGEFVERPLRPTDGGAYRSANGQTVTGGLQDPTIGRDPDDGEFVDLPAGGEPAVPLPDAGGTDGPSDVVGSFVQGGGSDGPEREQFNFPAWTVSRAGTYLNKKVNFEGRDDLEPLRERVNSARTQEGKIELNREEYDDFQRVVREGAESELESLEGREANIFGDAEEQREIAREAKQGIINNPPSRLL